jgi:hypothetical protein
MSTLLGPLYTHCTIMDHTYIPVMYVRITTSLVPLYIDNELSNKHGNQMNTSDMKSPQREIIINFI